jgi:fructosamine-3-kinase
MLAAENGFTGELQQEGDRLLSNLGQFFDGYWPEASLLHGDLWGGNWASSGGEPVIFDPAVYYGDRESDIAMTKLFGGFSAEFYRAYEEAWPLAAGNEKRILLYQLYHVLNHLNLFGQSYLGRALRIIRSLL